MVEVLALRYPTFEPGMPQILAMLETGLMDGGIAPSFMEDVEKSAAEDGYRVKDYTTWFDMHRGAWMATFNLERAHEHRS